MTSRRGWTLGVAVLAVAIASLYGPGLDAPFIYDDRPAIIDNPELRLLWPPHQLFVAPQDSPVAGRPLVAASFALNYAISGLSPWSYHLGNMLLHLANALLLMGLVRLTLMSTSLRAWALPVGFVAALLWTAHPLVTDAIQYITQRTELMVSFCYLATFYAFARAMHVQAHGDEVDEHRQQQIHRRWLMVAGAACALGMLCKEIMFAAPLLVLLYDRQFHAGTFAAALRQRPRFYGSLAASWLILAMLILSAPRSRSVGFGLGVSAWDYLLTQSQVLLWYVRLLAWPHPLSIHYHWPIVTHWTDAALTGPVILALLGGSIYGLVKRHPLGLVGMACFLILAPTSSLLPIVTEVAAERRMYLPAALLIAAAVAALAIMVRRLAPGQPHRVGAFAVIFVLAVAAPLAFATVQRVAQYHSRISIWEAALTVYPDAPVIHNNLGSALSDADRTEEAKRHFEQAGELGIGYIQSQYNLAVAELHAGRLDAAEAGFRGVIAQHPYYTEAYEQLGQLLFEQGRFADAVEVYQRAVEHNPRWAYAYQGLGIALQQRSRLGEAIRAFRRAIELDPQDTRARYNLGVALLTHGEHDQAVTAFTELAQRQPEVWRYQKALGQALLHAGRAGEAIAPMRRAVELDPRSAQRYTDLAVVLRQAGKQDEAAAALRRAAQLDPNPPLPSE